MPIATPELNRLYLNALRKGIPGYVGSSAAIEIASVIVVTRSVILGLDSDIARYFNKFL